MEKWEKFEEKTDKLPEPYRRLQQLSFDVAVSTKLLAETLDISFEEALLSYQVGLKVYDIEK